VQGELLDDFRDISGWSAVASGQAQLLLAQEEGPRGKALRLDFDFRGSGGFVVARKFFERALPARYAFVCNVRGSAPANRLEWKLVDRSGRNVWWAKREGFEFPREWSALRIASGEIEFAWGPAGGGAATELGALELAIVAGPGGRGSVWIDDLRLEDLSYRAQPIITANAEATDARGLASGWLGTPGEPLSLAIDFQEEREFGGLVVHWAPDAAPRSCEIAVSNDGERWNAVATLRDAVGERSFVFAPTSARHLRLDARAQDARGRVAIREIELLAPEVGRSPASFFTAVARRARRGLYPRYFVPEQSYWTPIGVAGAPTCALLSETGTIEPDRGSFSLEPFMFIDGSLSTWADAEVETRLAERWLPIPSSIWRARGVLLTTTAFGAGDPDSAVIWVRYQISSEATAARRVILFVALRPFQVTPPWQAFGELGGVSPIRELAYRDGAVWVNGSRAIVPLAEPSGFGASAFEHAAFPECLERGDLPQQSSVRDAAGWATGALRFDLELAPGAEREVWIAAPRNREDPRALRARSGAREFTAVCERWQRNLAQPEIRLPPPAQPCIDALRTAAAHILIVRDGAALQPGPRRYTRSWIRDAATMSAALLRLGRAREVADFLRWYAPQVARDGNVPCCVDRTGPDWLAEHDSHGQWIYTAAEHYRFTGDRALAEELWPSLRAAAGYLERLRAQRLAPEFAVPERRACYGILPESVSHEGYLAHPVHAYWDDFWALRGLSDAAWLAAALGHDEDAAHLRGEYLALHECLYASIAATIADRGLATLPGSVEWADFDPSASANGLAISDAIECLPADLLARTYDQYLAGFRKRLSGELDWANYTPYEIRIIGALVRLGRRAEAHELLAAFLADRRPLAWNQWPEIAWRDPRSPGHLGDLPHTWVGAEYVLAVLSLFAYERPADDALVLAAGIPGAWLAGGFEVAVDGFATAFGTLSYRICALGDGRVTLALSSPIAPPGGIVLRPPLPGPLRGVEIDGRPAPFDAAGGVALERGPATVVFHW
jgi:hypothetical protein